MRIDVERKRETTVVDRGNENDGFVRVSRSRLSLDAFEFGKKVRAELPECPLAIFRCAPDGKLSLLAGQLEPQSSQDKAGRRQDHEKQ